VDTPSVTMRAHVSAGKACGISLSAALQHQGPSVHVRETNTGFSVVCLPDRIPAFS